MASSDLESGLQSVNVYLATVKASASEDEWHQAARDQKSALLAKLTMTSLPLATCLGLNYTSSTCCFCSVYVLKKNCAVGESRLRHKLACDVERLRVA